MTHPRRDLGKNRSIDMIKELDLLPTLTIYSIVEKYVPMNNKENAVNFSF